MMKWYIKRVAEFGIYYIKNISKYCALIILAWLIGTGCRPDSSAGISGCDGWTHNPGTGLPL